MRVILLQIFVLTISTVSGLCDIFAEDNGSGGNGSPPAGYIYPTCYLSIIADVNFGSVNPYDAIPETTQGTIRVTCTKGSNTLPNNEKIYYTLIFSSGLSNEMLDRKTANASNFDHKMQYNIFSNSSYSSKLGLGTTYVGIDNVYANYDCSGSTVCIGSSSLMVKNSQPTNYEQHTIYAKMPVQSISSEGFYSDNINVTLNYWTWDSY